MDAHRDNSFFERWSETLRLCRLAIALAWRAQPLLVGTILLLLVVQATLPPLQLWFTQALLDRLTFDLGLVPQAQDLVRALPLAGWIGLAAAAIALAQFLQPLSATLHVMAGDRITGFLSVELIRAVNRWQGLARFEDPNVADDVEFARLHIEEGGGLEIVYAGTRAALTSFTIVAIVVVLGGLHPLVPLALILFTLPALRQQWNFGKRMGSHLYWRAAEARRLEYDRAMMLIPETAKDVRLYGLAPFFAEHYTGVFNRAIREIDGLRRGMVPRVTLAGLLATLAVGGLWVWLAWRISLGEESLGAFVLYGGAAMLLYRQLLGVGSDLGSLPVTLSSLNTFQRVLDAPPDLPQPNQAKATPRPIRQGIVFEHVGFAYPGSDTLVLDDVSFRLRPGESTALVGRNGAGKTTIIKLLLRFYDPSRGRILLDGVDLRDYDLADLRRTIGAIFQDFVQFELTAGENVGLGSVESLNDNARILAAAGKSGADEVISRLPQGLESQLGRRFGGRELSGGEWQRLALARGFMRDAPLIVLDEPTAALDVETEHAVYQRFQMLTRDKITVLISHRFSTVRMADSILFLADGRIAEAGTHDTLMARDGAYSRLYRLQAERYADIANEAGEE